jgi:hypothetical protein
MLTVSRTQDKPHYRPGLWACIACCLLTLVIVSLITLGSWRSNKKADRGEIELEYHDVGSLSMCIISNVNESTGDRPEGLQVYILSWKGLAYLAFEAKVVDPLAHVPYDCPIIPMNCFNDFPCSSMAVFFALVSGISTFTLLISGRLTNDCSGTVGDTACIDSSTGLKSVISIRMGCSDDQ